MPRCLLIEVRFHEGRYHGEDDGFSSAGGWPPSPARLFQALVAAAARGARLQPDDEQALKWLEGLAPPEIVAPAARRGQAITRFVPNNDLDSVGGDPARVSEIRVGKTWRPCIFDLDQPVLYTWRFEAGTANAVRICAIAERLCQLGRGIDTAWASARVLDHGALQSVFDSHPGARRVPAGAGSIAVPRPGTLDSLVNRHRHNRVRLRTVGVGRGKSRQLFAKPPKALLVHTGYDAPARDLHFELRTTERAFAPVALASAASLIASLRDAAALRLQQALPEQTTLFERLIVGRGAGPRDLADRIRLLPIPSIGTEHTDPSIRRIMVEIPADCPIAVADLRWAFAWLQPDKLQTGSAAVYLVSTEDARMASRFTRRAHAFRTITPVALSGAQRRRLGTASAKTADERRREERQAAGAVVQALRHAGVRARPTDIRVQREPLQMRGTRADLFAEGTRFSKHALWHVVCRFAEEVEGPLVIGDGRFCGLGLMQPVNQRRAVFVFNLGSERRVAPADGAALMAYLRRALMALARDDEGRVARLFSGHEADGELDRGGHHRHVFLAADGGAADEPPITRLVVAAPWAVDRLVAPQSGDRRRFDEVTRRLVELRAGRLGRFDSIVADPIEDGDPLVGPTRTWISRTPYVATRNLKRYDDHSLAVCADVVTECHRRGLPTPAVDTLVVSAGPRGGRPTARLKLLFATAVRGPLILGRNSHSGGGLFHAVQERT